MNRKVYCSCDSDFKSHFITQAGKGFTDLTVFQGQPYQRGYGIGSLIKRFGIPVLKFLSKQFVKTGVNVGNDYLSGVNIKESLKTRGKAGLKSAAKEGLGQLDQYVDQIGSGIRKRKRTNHNKVSKRMKKDIFS